MKHTEPGLALTRIPQSNPIRPRPRPRSSKAMRAKLLLAVHEGQAAFYLS